MIILDTDHTTVLKYRGTERCNRLVSRLAMVVDEDVGTTIITVEEQMRGWLATIAKERKAIRQVTPYRELAELFEFFSEYEVVRFDDAAAIFDTFSSIHIGSMDRKIAAIALANNAPASHCQPQRLRTNPRPAFRELDRLSTVVAIAKGMYDHGTLPRCRCSGMRSSTPAAPTSAFSITAAAWVRT